VLVDPARGALAGPVPAAGARAADELGALGGHCRGRQSALCPRGTLPVLVDPARGALAGPVPAAGARAADELGGSGWPLPVLVIRFAVLRRAGVSGWRPGC